MATKELKLGRRNQVTLPSEFIPKGISRFICEKREGIILLIPCKIIPATQEYFWTKRWQEGEEKSSENIHTDRIHKYASVDELLIYLDEKRKEKENPPPSGIRKIIV